MSEAEPKSGDQGTCRWLPPDPCPRASARHPVECKNLVLRDSKAALRLGLMRDDPDAREGAPLPHIGDGHPRWTGTTRCVHGHVIIATAEQMNEEREERCPCCGGPYAGPLCTCEGAVPQPRVDTGTSTLEPRLEPGGWRHYIRENAIHAGDRIQYLPAGESEWIDGRYEWNFRLECAPTFYYMDTFERPCAIRLPHNARVRMPRT